MRTSLCSLQWSDVDWDGFLSKLTYIFLPVTRTKYHALYWAAIKHRIRPSLDAASLTDRKKPPAYNLS